MRRQRFWKIALLLAVPLALFAITAERNSWRPRVIKAVEATGVKFSPNGRYLAILAGGVSNQSILLYDMQAARLRSKIEKAESPIFFLSSDRLATRGGSDRHSAQKDPISDDCIGIYSVPQGKLISVGPELLAFDGVLADETTLVGSDDRPKGRILISWDARGLESPQPILPLLEKLRPPHSAFGTSQLLEDRKTLMVSFDQEVKVQNTLPKLETTLQFWDMNTKRLRFQLSVTPYSNHYFTSSINGLCAWRRGGTNLGTVDIWNCQTGQRVNTLHIPGDGWGALSPDGTLLAIGGDTRTINLWDTRSGHISRTLKAYASSPVWLAFSPDGRTLASSTNNGSVTLWRIK